MDFATRVGVSAACRGYGLAGDARICGLVIGGKGSLELIWVMSLAEQNMGWGGYGVVFYIYHGVAKWRLGICLTSDEAES